MVPNADVMILRFKELTTAQTKLELTVGMTVRMTADTMTFVEITVGMTVGVTVVGVTVVGVTVGVTALGMTAIGMTVGVTALGITAIGMTVGMTGLEIVFRQTIGVTCSQTDVKKTAIGVTDPELACKQTDVRAIGPAIRMTGPEIARRQSDVSKTGLQTAIATVRKIHKTVELIWLKTTAMGTFAVKTMNLVFLVIEAASKNVARTTKPTSDGAYLNRRGKVSALGSHLPTARGRTVSDRTIHRFVIRVQGARLTGGERQAPNSLERGGAKGVPYLSTVKPSNQERRAAAAGGAGGVDEGHEEPRLLSCSQQRLILRRSDG